MQSIIMRDLWKGPMMKKGKILFSIGLLAATFLIYAGIAFADNHYTGENNPSFTQQSKGIYVYSDGTEDLIVLDARDIDNLKLYSDAWDGVIATQLAPAFDNTKDYIKGEVVTYENHLLICKEDITHDGTFPAAKFENVRVTELLSGAGADMSSFKQTVDDFHENIIGLNAEAYNEQRTYSKGDACSYDGRIYVCNKDASTAGQFQPSEFDAVTLISFISEINKSALKQDDRLQDVEDSISDKWSMGHDYTAGEYVIYEDCLYLCKVDLSGSAVVPPDDATHFEPTKISSILEYVDDFKMSVSGGGSKPYKLTITKVA